MVEEPDREVGPQAAQHLRHQLKLVIVHPHGRAGRAHRFGRGREAPVDLDVGLPPVATIGGWGNDIVVQRPQRLVGEPLVVALHLGGAQRYGDDVNPGQLERFELQIRLTGPANPGAIARPHDRLKRGHQSAGRGVPVLGAVRRGPTVDRQAVRDHNERELAVAAGWFAAHETVYPLFPKTLADAEWAVPRLPARVRRLRATSSGGCA